MRTLKLLAACYALLLGGTAFAQDEPAAPLVSDDSAVWSVIERAWRAEREGNTRWIESLLSADFVGWTNDAPAPRDKASTRLWNAFDSKQNNLLEYELYPLSIIVHGDTAIAHYLYSSAVQPKGENVESVNGRFTDVLVRSADGWKFLSWHGGAE